MVGNKFRRLRKEMKMTYEKFGVLLNLSKGYLSDIEHGRRNPSISTLMHVSDRLGIRPEYFFTDKDYEDSKVSEEEMISKIAYVEKGREILEQLYDLDKLSIEDRLLIIELIKTVKTRKGTEK